MQQLNGIDFDRVLHYVINLNYKMVTLHFVKDDWVKEKNGSRLMQVDEYQIVESVSYASDNQSHPIVKRIYNGKVWCTWVNDNKTVVTQPFWEDDLEPASPKPVGKEK
jgi:uncharacterized protein YodC (DUF2158 family)